MPENSDKPLHVTELATGGAALALGTLACQQLSLHGTASFYLNEEGFVQVAHPGELQLDALPEEMAIRTLFSQRKSEEDIELYLRGRDARMKRG